MRSDVVRALRGTLAAVSLLAFAALSIALEARVTSPTVLGSLAAVGTVTLLTAAGRSGARRLLGRGESAPASRGESTAEGDAWLDEPAEEKPWTDEPADETPWTDEPADETPWIDRSDRAGADSDPDWALARLEPALDDAWNRWSDAALTLGLAALGVDALGFLAAHPGDDPPLVLPLLVAFGLNGALVTLPFVFFK